MAELIWLVEDDDALAAPLMASLRSAGFQVSRTAGVRSTIDAVSALLEPPDLVLLDLGLPDGDGTDLARRLRLLAPSTVIVVLTARTEEADVVLALDAGADDYLTKPYRLAEILARVRAHLRRQGEHRDVRVVEASGVRVDTAARTVEVDGTAIPLRAKEFELLADLVSHAGEAVRREDLMSRVWDQHWDGPTKTLDMHVSWLRRKLADAGRPDVIATVRGVGYRFERTAGGSP